MNLFSETAATNFFVKTRQKSLAGERQKLKNPKSIA